MLPIRTPLLCLCMILATGVAWSQEYTLKTKEDAQGHRNRLNIVNTFKMDVHAENAGKQVKVTEITGTETMVFVETILAKKGTDKATQLRREYETAVIEKQDGSKTTLPIQGKKILIERKEGAYEFKVEGGGEVDNESADFLKNEFQMSDDLAEPDKLLRPKKPVKVGETWTLDMGPIAKNYARTTPVPLEESKAKGQGKLVKVYKNEGRDFAVIEVEIEIPVKTGVQGALTVGEGSKLTLKQKVDGAFDGKLGTQTFESQMNLDIQGMLDAGGGKNVKTTMTGRGTFRAQVTDLK